MRSPHHVLFPWAYQDRIDQDVPRFRELASRWHPVVRCARDEDDMGAFAIMNFGTDRRSSPLPRPTWSPWLWVK